MQNLVRKLEVCEHLGCVDTILCEKNGVLTKNQLEVLSLATSYNIFGPEYESK